MAPPLFRAVGTPVDVASSTTWTLAKPSGTLEDDLMLACFAYEGPTSSITGGTVPSGWALAATPTAVSWPHCGVIYYKVADAVDYTLSDYTWTLSTAEPGVGFIVAYSNVDTSAPIEDGAAQVAPSDASPPYQYVTDSVTVAGRDRLLFAHFSMVTASGTSWTASGMTERADRYAGVQVTSAAAFERVGGVAGSYSRTGAATTNGIALGVVATLLAVKPGPFLNIAPVNTVAPVATGDPTVGETLSCTDGTWTADPTPSFTYQWQRDGVNIGGATDSTYELVEADELADVRCVVTATNDIIPAGTANSNALGPVEPEPPLPDAFMMTASGYATTAGRLMTAGGLVPPP